jgi:hypothetical protein
MSLPIIAIIVSAVSALFTASNMLISAATYRRGGPRMKIRALRFPLNPFRAFNTGDDSLMERVIHIHVINRSASAVNIDRVELDLYRRIPKWIERSLLMRSALPWKDAPEMLSFIEGADRKNIPPFGGVRWIMREQINRPKLRLWFRLLFISAREARVRVTLTNGAQIRSNRVSNWRLNIGVRGIERIYRWSRPHEEANPNPNQLSFDDILREAED